MSITTLSLLATTTVGTPSGNYDGSTQDFYGDPQRAVNYYAGQGSIQTVFIRVTNFEGIITVQATLDDDPDQARWVDTYTYDHASSSITDYHPVTVTGNYTFMRVAITEFQAGTIEFVNLAY